MYPLCTGTEEQRHTTFLCLNQLNYQSIGHFLSLQLNHNQYPLEVFMRRLVRTSPPVFVPLVILAILCTCSFDKNRHRFQTYREDGVDVALTSGGPRHSDPLFRFEPVMTLKQDPEREDSLLYRPSIFFMGPDGYFYVEDNRNHRIAVFNPQGEYERSFGRAGAGPGEFGEYWAIVGFDGSVLTIQDVFQRRLTRYRTDGHLLDTITPSKGGMFDRVHHAPGGRLVVIDGESEFRDGGLFLRSLALVTDASMADTLAVVRSGWVEIARSVARDDGTERRRPTIYSSSPTTLYVPGRGILTTSGMEPAVDWYDLDGRLTNRIRIELPVQPVTASMRSEYMATRNAMLTEGENPRPPLSRDYFAFSEHVGYWRDVRVDDAGYIWLRDVMDHAAFENPNGFLYHVIDSEGRYLGMTYIPTDLGWTICRGNLLYMDRDEVTGERIPTVSRVVSAVPGLDYP